LITGGMYQGDTGAPQMSSWPVYAPRLGASFRNPIFASIFPNLNTRYLTDMSSLPVGYGGLPPVLQQVIRLPELARSTTLPKKDPFYGEIDRRDTPLSEVTQNGGAVRQAKDWIEYWQLKAQGIEVLAPTAAARAAGADYMATTSPTTGNGSMDLGQLITDLGGQYIQARYGQPSPSTGYYQPPIQATPALAPAVAGGIGLAAGELYDYFMDENGTMSARKKCKKRRRRKRLATVSDIADLAALKSILGNGDAFKTWIATHSR